MIRYCTLYLFFIHTLFFTILTAGLINPPNNSELNYIHVLFEWDQVPGASSYNIEIAYDSQFDEIIKVATVTSLVFIEEESIDWDSNYYWRVRPNYDSPLFSDWIDSFSFSTGSKRSNATAIIYDENNINHGITIFSSFYNYYSAMIDANGREIWNTGENNIVYYNTNDALDLLGCYSDNSLEHNLPGIEFSLNTNFVWEEPNDQFLHHDLIKLPNGNYMGIVETSQLGPIPIGPWTGDYHDFGFTANGITAEFPWVGDKLIEWDKDTKEIVWTWSVFDHFSMDDFDDLGGTWLSSSTGFQKYDWTHVNALMFSEQESALYISTRHLSRITKISYPSGDIIWNMGRDMPSGDVSMGNEIGFSFQHGLQILDNGNIVTFDNGNLSESFLGTEYPTSRVLEISLNNDQAQIVWEYSLPEELFGFASGNAQKLDNGNYLITTVGGNGTSLEVTNIGEEVWRGNYNLCEPICAVYRANRIPSLYPIAFSLIVNELSENNVEGYESQPTVNLPLGNAEISFTLKNEGSITETFNYQFVEQLDWFEDVSGSIEIEPGSAETITFNGTTSNSAINSNFELIVVPSKKISLARTYSFDIKLNSLSTAHELPNKSIEATLLEPFPNPFNSNIKIGVKDIYEVGLKIDIYDVSGKIIHSIPVNDLSETFYSSWDGAGFPSGIYFLKLNKTFNNQIKKIMFIK